MELLNVLSVRVLNAQLSTVSFDSIIAESAAVQLDLDLRIFTPRAYRFHGCHSLVETSMDTTPPPWYPRRSTPLAGDACSEAFLFTLRPAYSPYESGITDLAATRERLIRASSGLAWSQTSQR